MGGWVVKLLRGYEREVGEIRVSRAIGTTVGGGGGGGGGW